MISLDRHNHHKSVGFNIPAKLLYGCIVVFAIAAAAVLYVLDPREPGNYPVCPFLGLSGYHCPGCGTLRALHQLLHGSPLSALGYNFLAVLSLPFLVYSFAAGALRAFRLPSPAPVFIQPWLVWAILVGVVAFWVLRNIPVHPLTVLAP